MSENSEHRLKLGDFLINIIIGDIKKSIDGLNLSGKSIFEQSGTLFSIILLSPLQIFMALLLGAIAGSAVIATIISAESYGNSVNSNELLALAFLMLLLVYFISQNSLLDSCSLAIEKSLESRRTKILTDLLSIDYSEFEKINKEEIISVVTRHFESISKNIPAIFWTLRSVIQVIFILLYLATLSLTAAGICLLMILFTVYSFQYTRKELTQLLRESEKSENEFNALVSDLISGIKELSRSKKLSVSFLDDAMKIISKSSKDRMNSLESESHFIVISSTISLLFAGSIVFLLPVISSHNLNEIAKIAAVSLFIIGPTIAAINGAQQWLRAQFSINQISLLSERLRNIVSLNPIESKEYIGDFQIIDIRDATYRRPPKGGEAGFKVEKINLTIRPGSISFITGNNGSGKTTLLRIITGMYFCDSGEIYYNSHTLSRENIASYREKFGVIDSEYHLFNRPYGYNEKQINEVNKNIKYFGLDNLLHIAPDITVDHKILSTGQRKRLALAFLMSEERPIYVFDEWAADQDPIFRELFYTKILPELKKQGKAIIAVTHDDKYFHLADSLFRMESGNLYVH